MPGLRKPRVGEVVLCNYPHGRENFKIEFRINYVYAKRILGCPGDTVGVRNGFCYNTSYDGNVLQAYTFVHDYYYLIGDNVLNSKDSRYFGFVPELYIIGIIG